MSQTMAKRPAPLLTVSELCEWLQVTPGWVYKSVSRASENPLPHRKVGGHLRFQANEIEAWIKQGVNGASEWKPEW